LSSPAPHTPPAAPALRVGPPATSADFRSATRAARRSAASTMKSRASSLSSRSTGVTRMPWAILLGIGFPHAIRFRPDFCTGGLSVSNVCQSASLLHFLQRFEVSAGHSARGPFVFYAVLDVRLLALLAFFLVSLIPHISRAISNARWSSPGF